MMKTLMCDPKLFTKHLKGQVYIVTGANSGAGLATMTQLVRQGAHVVAACRRVSAGEQAVRKLSGGPGSTEVIEIDLGSLTSVRRFTEIFLARHKRLDGLVNNAGVMNTPEGKTEDGFEIQFGTNHLGHFLLTELLLDCLKASVPSRISIVIVLLSRNKYTQVTSSRVYSVLRVLGYIQTDNNCRPGFSH